MAVTVGQLNNLGTCPFKSVNTRTLYTGTSSEKKGRVSLAFWTIVVTCPAAHVAGVRGEAGIKCLSRTEKREGPTLVAQKCGHDFHMSLRSKVRKHRDTKHQSGLPNLLLALSVSTTSAYSNLGVLQGIEPRTSATNSISLPLSHISCHNER